MTMTLPPIEQEEAAAKTPAAVAERRKRAEKLAPSLSQDEVIELLTPVPLARQNGVAAPRHFLDQFSTKAQIAEAEVQVARNLKELIIEELEYRLLREDLQAIYENPDRVAEIEIWQAYTKQVSSIAWAQGDRSDGWISRWQELVRDRAVAEEWGESTASIDARLEQMVGVPYPEFKPSGESRHRGRKPH